MASVTEKLKKKKAEEARALANAENGAPEEILESAEEAEKQEPKTTPSKEAAWAVPQGSATEQLEQKKKAQQSKDTTPKEQSALDEIEQFLISDIENTSKGLTHLFSSFDTTPRRTGLRRSPMSREELDKFSERGTLRHSPMDKAELDKFAEPDPKDKKPLQEGTLRHSPMSRDELMKFAEPAPMSKEAKEQPLSLTDDDLKSFSMSRTDAGKPEDLSAAIKALTFPKAPPQAASAFPDMPPDDYSELQKAFDTYDTAVSRIEQEARTERDDLRKRQLIEQLVLGVSKIAAGVYGLRAGVDTSGAKFVPSDWAAEAKMISEQLESSRDTAKAALARGTTFAQMKEEGKKNRNAYEIQKAAFSEKVRESALQWAMANGQFNLKKQELLLQNEDLKAKSEQQAMALARPNFMVKKAKQPEKKHSRFATLFSRN
jgi:hypothetical protein